MYPVVSLFMAKKKKRKETKKCALLPTDRRTVGNFYLPHFIYAAAATKQREVAQKDCLAVTFFCNCFTNIFGNFQEGVGASPCSSLNLISSNAETGVGAAKGVGPVREVMVSRDSFIKLSIK